MVKDFARVLRDKIRTDMNNFADDIATGRCQSFDAYKQLCGVIQGLAMAERHLMDLLDKLETDDD